MLPDLDDPTFKRSYADLAKISSTYTETISAVMKHVHLYEQIAESVQKSMRPMLEVIASNQAIYDQMAKALANISVPKIVVGDLFQNWAIQNPEVDEVIESPSGLAEDLGFDLIESIENEMDESPYDDSICHLQLTSNGRLHLIEDPDVYHDLTPQMEQLIRDLRKGQFRRTKTLVHTDGYSTERSVRAAIEKLNRWGRGAFGMTKPIVVGIQGKGYRLTKHVQIRKLPRNFAR